jgi:hypothetical protein
MTIHWLNLRVSDSFKQRLRRRGEEDWVAEIATDIADNGEGAAPRWKCDNGRLLIYSPRDESP